MKTPQDVIAFIEEHDVKFIDLRFTDTKGKEQHVTIPVSQIDEEFFEAGKMFDGSSINGWKGINESDMVLMPDCDTIVLDTFTYEVTLNVVCVILDPATMLCYVLYPRNIARRASHYISTT